VLADLTRADAGATLPPPLADAAPELPETGRFAEIWAPPLRRRTIMMVVFQFCQTIGFYGFASWVPTLIAQKGINLSGSLQYAFIIAIANPVGPLLALGFADRIERRWLLVAAAGAIALCGLAFAAQNEVPMLILFGVLLTLANNVLSFTFHAYQSELFPTRIRARAVGFVYSWSRLSAVFASFMIAFFLKLGGVPAVFFFIAGAMVIVMIAIGGFGPNTRGRQLEAISR
jgi:putative MFS transporter